jgi:hypothetical protein
MNSKLSIIKHTLLLLVIGSGVANAQEAAETFKPKIRGAIMMANSHIPAATIDGKKITIVPTWGFDIDYVFHPKWSVAVQTDINLQSFEVKDGDVEWQRTNPFSLTGILHYHTLPHWSVYTGPGYEFESHKNLFLFKLGTESGSQ